MQNQNTVPTPGSDADDYEAAAAAAAMSGDESPAAGSVTARAAELLASVQEADVGSDDLTPPGTGVESSVVGDDGDSAADPVVASPEEPAPPEEGDGPAHWINDIRTLRPAPVDLGLTDEQQTLLSDQVTAAVRYALVQATSAGRTGINPDSVVTSVLFAMFAPVFDGEVTTVPKFRDEPISMGTSAAVRELVEALRNDNNYAWGWHCNIVMSMVDAGVPHDKADEGSARFLSILTQDVEEDGRPGINVREFEQFKSTAKNWASETTEPAAETPEPEAPALDVAGFSQALKNDGALAWDIHSKIASAFREEGVAKLTANVGAASALRGIFGVETTQNPAFQQAIND